MKCNNIILSEEYGDFIGRDNGEISEALTEQVECTQVIDDSYFCAYYRLDMLPTINVANFTYNVIPKLYGLMDTTAVATTGSIRLQNQSGFNLTGRDVIIGFIDTGIDYTNKLFQKSTGQTRILSIWAASIKHKATRGLYVFTLRQLHENVVNKYNIIFLILKSC